jgi:hypothetical protein
MTGLVGNCKPKAEFLLDLLTSPDRGRWQGNGGD